MTRGTPIWKFTNVPITDILSTKLPIPIPIFHSSGFHLNIKGFKHAYCNKCTKM